MKTRRAFIKGVAATGGMVPMIGKMLPAHVQQPRTSAGPEGKKGATYPDQRKQHRDSKSGRTVWQLSDNPGTTQVLHMYARHTTPDSRFLMYLSDRAGEKDRFNLFKMDLRTGESVQLTESGAIIPGSSDTSYDGKQVYYLERGNVLRTVNTESLQEREICRLPKDVREAGNALEISPDGKYLIFGRQLEGFDRRYGYMWVQSAIHNVVYKVDVATGRIDNLDEGMVHMAHFHVCPTDPNLILASIHGPNWSWCQHTWLMDSKGKFLGKVFPQVNGEAVGHELWSKNGKTIYAGCHGGRWPQGLWAVNVDGSNERCVLIGSAVGHNTVNGEEDRFATDEMFGDGSEIWMSTKADRKPKVLCQMAANWFEKKPNGLIAPTRYHPDIQFLPNGQGLVYSSGGQIYLVEV